MASPTRFLNILISLADLDSSTLVDFEYWSPFSGMAGDDEKELQSWGLASRPASKNWWAEFGIHTY